jgi:hypothetical protein
MKMARELDYIAIKSRLYSMAEGDMSLECRDEMLADAPAGLHKTSKRTL